MFLIRWSDVTETGTDACCLNDVHPFTPQDWGFLIDSLIDLHYVIKAFGHAVGQIWGAHLTCNELNNRTSSTPAALAKRLVFRCRVVEQILFVVIGWKHWKFRNPVKFSRRILSTDFSLRGSSGGPQSRLSDTNAIRLRGPRRRRSHNINNCAGRKKSCCPWQSQSSLINHLCLCATASC